MMRMLQPLRHYADLKGRSSRTEYWFFILLVLVVIALAGLAMLVVTGSSVSGAAMATRFTVWAGFAIAPLIVPLVAVTVRRLHDLGLSGWWLAALIIGGAIPAVDTLVALAHVIIMALPGRKRANRFGEPPAASSRPMASGRLS